MNITYFYKVLNVDQENKTMEVQYEHAEYGLMHVFARIPYQDETLDSVIQMYAPIAYWIQKTKEHQTVDAETTYGYINWTDEKTLEERESEVRMLRNQLLLLSDYTQLTDAPASINKEAWEIYRQELRDITSQVGFPDSVVWPNVPL